MPNRSPEQLELSNLYVRWITKTLTPEDSILVLQHSEELEAMRQRAYEFYFNRGRGESDWFDPEKS